MFGLQERVFSVIGQDRYDRLGDHRTSVHCWGHPMDRTAGELLISFERLALRVKAGKIRQQRGADVDGIRPCQRVAKPALRTRINPASAIDRPRLSIRSSAAVG